MAKARIIVNEVYYKEAIEKVLYLLSIREQPNSRLMRSMGIESYLTQYLLLKLVQEGKVDFRIDKHIIYYFIKEQGETNGSKDI